MKKFFSFENIIDAGDVINSTLTVLCCNKESLINNPSRVNDDKRSEVDFLNAI